MFIFYFWALVNLLLTCFGKHMKLANDWCTFNYAGSIIYIFKLKRSNNLIIYLRIARKVLINPKKTSLMKSALESGFIYESILIDIKIKTVIGEKRFRTRFHIWIDPQKHKNPILSFISNKFRRVYVWWRLVS